MKKSVKIFCVACVLSGAAFAMNPSFFSELLPNALPSIEKVSFVNKEAPMQDRKRINYTKIRDDLTIYTLSKHKELDRDIKIFASYYLAELYNSHGIYMLGVSVVEPVSHHNLPNFNVLYRDGHIYELAQPNNGQMQSLAVRDKSVIYYSYTKNKPATKSIVGRILIDGKKYIKQEVEYKGKDVPIIVVKRDRITDEITFLKKKLGKLTSLGTVQDDYFDEFVILEGADKTRNKNFVKH